MARKRYYVGGVRTPYAQFKKLTKAVVPEIFQDLFNKAAKNSPIKWGGYKRRKYGISRRSYTGNYDSRRK